MVEGPLILSMLLKMFRFELVEGRVPATCCASDRAGERRDLAEGEQALG